MIPLNLVDLKKLNGIIEDRTHESGRADISYHLKKWSREKNNLYNIFGEKLKIKRPLEVSKSLVSIDLAVNDFVKTLNKGMFGFFIFLLFTLFISLF